MNVTMQQVADAAGVHRTTVSLALRRHPSIPAATAERIRSIAEQLDYRPNPLITTLMSQLGSQRRRASNSREVIALVDFHPITFSTKSYPSLANMLEGATEQAARLGFNLETFNRHGTNMTSARLRKILQTRGVRTLIIGPLPGDKTTIDMDVSGFAAVALGSSLRHPPLERIASDHYQCMRLAFENCMRLGYTRIGVAIGQLLSTRLEDRWLAAALSIQQYLPPESRVPPCLPSTPASIPKWLRRERPDVIIAPLRNNWRDFQLQNGNIPIANLTRLPEDNACAGINQNMHKVGRMSVERVVSRLHQNDFGALEETQNTFLHGTWSNGASLPPKNLAKPPARRRTKQ